MNGRRARQLRELALNVVIHHGIRTGSADYRQHRRVYRRMKRDYRRTGVIVPAGIPSGLLRGR